jgi:hypothetical protein
VGLVGNPRTLQALKKALRAMPITVSANIAARSAPDMTRLALGSFDSGRTAYDQTRPRGVDGQALSLEKSGATRTAIQFVATGRDIRLTRLPRYSRYLIGKYDMLPNGPLPLAWRERMTEIAAQVLHAQIFGAGA